MSKESACRRIIDRNREFWLFLDRLNGRHEMFLSPRAAERRVHKRYSVSATLGQYEASIILYVEIRKSILLGDEDGKHRAVE